MIIPKEKIGKCKHCQKEFLKLRSDASYCSSNCRQYYFRAKRKAVEDVKTDD